MEGAIIAHTSRIAEELASRHATDPKTELRVWLKIAEQREAMVVALYAGSAIQRRIPEEDVVAATVGKTIGSIWAQEASHTQLLGALRRVGEESGPRIEAALGALEGSVTSYAASRGLTGEVARWLIGIARATGFAPEFTRAIRAMRFDQFCRFANELEQTAAHGYARVLSLIDRLDEDPDAPPRFGITLRYEIAKTFAEERFHAAVFERIESWLAADGEHFAVRSPRQCLSELHDLAQGHLTFSAVRELPPALREAALEHTRAVDGGAWISDGGIGGLLQSHGFDSPVVKSTTLLPLLATVEQARG